MNAAKRGRPRLGANLVKRHPLNMKATFALRTQLEAAAELSGRSLSLEVEDRLAASFLPHDVVFGSDETQALLRAIAGVVQVVEASTGKGWNNDGQTAEVAYQAITKILPRAVEGTVQSDVSTARAVIVGMLHYGLFDEQTTKAVVKLIGAEAEEEQSGLYPQA